MAAKIRKRGQMAIWVIVALIIVISIGILLLAGNKKKIDTFVQETYDVEPYIERCARQAVRETLTQMIPYGGFLKPKSYKQYNGMNITYLCENIGNFEPCISQHPVLLEEIRQELRQAIEPLIDECFLDMKDVLEERAITVSLGTLDFDVALGAQQINLNIERSVIIKDRETTRTFDRFDVSVVHPTYDLANVAIEISSQEAKYCYFEYVGYMILHPEFDIQKTALSDSTKIYTIKDIRTEEVMRIATRSCAIPPGV